MKEYKSKEQYEVLYNSICEKINNLKKELKSIEINKIITMMGFPMNKK